MTNTKRPLSKYEHEFERICNEYKEKRCTLCYGSGRVMYQEAYYWVPMSIHQPPTTVEVVCPACKGSGYQSCNTIFTKTDIETIQEKFSYLANTGHAESSEQI